MFREELGKKRGRRFRYYAGVVCSAWLGCLSKETSLGRNSERFARLGDY